MCAGQTGAGATSYVATNPRPAIATVAGVGLSETERRYEPRHPGGVPLDPDRRGGRRRVRPRAQTTLPPVTG